MSFGQIMKKLRGDFHMTQERLAELLDISPQAVSRWETNAAMPIGKRMTRRKITGSH